MGNFVITPAVYENGAYAVEPYVDIGDAFYTDIANYSVRINVPEGYRIAATGELGADGMYMTAIGEYNTRNSHKAFVIGNGTSDKDRRDIFTVSWAGGVGIADNIYMELGDCYIRDSGTALSVTDGASTLDGLLAQAIINTFSYADAKYILDMPEDENMNVKKLLQKIVEKLKR